MRRGSIVALMCLVMAAGESLAAGGDQTPVFKGAVTLITVDVRVLDAAGAPVPGLSAADFDVTLDGQSRPVKALDYLTASAPAPVAVAPALADVPPRRRTATNARPSGESAVDILLVDDLSFSPGRGKDLFAAAGRFIGTLPPADYVGFTTSSQTSAVNPTRDRAAVRTALEGAVGEFSDPRALTTGAADARGSATATHSLGVTESIEIDRGTDAVLKDVIVRECFGGDSTTVDSQGLINVLGSNACASDVRAEARRIAALTHQTAARQLQAYQSVIDAMRTAPGLKHLIILSDGLGVYQDVESIAPLARAAASAGVDVSVILEEPDQSMADTGPSAVNGAPVSSSPALRRRDDDKMFASGIETVADITGGNFYRVVGSPDAAFAKVAASATAIYRLGVEAPTQTTASRDFAVSVSVRRPGVTVHANRRAVMPEAPATPTPDDMDAEMREALVVGRPFYDIPMQLATAVRRSATPGATTLDLGVNVEIPATVKGPLTTVFGLVSSDGQIKSGRRIVDVPADGGDYHISFVVPVPPGQYHVRFTAANLTPEIGSIDVPVDASLATVGPFQASDLVMSWADSDGKAQFLAIEDVPPAAHAVDAALELYPPPAGPPADVRVHFALVPIGGGAPVVEQDVTPEAAGGALRAMLALSMDRLAAGRYVLHATVSAGGQTLGTVSAPLTKR